MEIRKTHKYKQLLEYSGIVRSFSADFYVANARETKRYELNEKYYYAFLLFAGIQFLINSTI